MMGIVVPETYWASNKICNKNNLLYLVGILFPHTNDDARVKTTPNIFINYLRNGPNFCTIIVGALRVDVQLQLKNNNACYLVSLTTH